MRLASSLALALTLGLLVAAGCGKSTTGPSPADAEAMASCAPADGPAVTIRFAASGGDRSTPPIVQATVYRPRAELAGTQWTLPSEQANVMLQRTEHPEFDVATEGRIAIESVGADGTITGTVHARFPDGTQVRRAFRAAWQERAVLCA